MAIFMKVTLKMEIIMEKDSFYGQTLSLNMQENLKTGKCMGKEYFKILMAFLMAVIKMDI